MTDIPDLNAAVEVTHNTEPAYVLTLVHGTFARGAPWTHEESAFTKALVDALAAPVRVERHDWSGRNSLAHRAEAAERLGGKLESLRKWYPNAKHYVIGHSHGGAVAYYATARVDGLDGVICLSTPFLNLYERPYSELLLGSLYWGLAFLMPIAGASLGYIGATGLDTLGVFRWVLGLVCVILGAALGWLGSALFFAFLIEQRNFIKRLIWPHTKGNILIVRMPGDEASLVLGLANCISWLWNAVVSVVFLPVLWCDSVLEDMDSKGQPKSKVLSRLASTAFSLLGLFQPAYMLLMVPLLIPFVLISIIPFGVGLAIHAMFVEINVDVTPHGVWKVCCVPNPRSKSVFGLRHSSYEAPAVIGLLTDWMRSGEVDVTVDASPRERVIGV